MRRNKLHIPHPVRRLRRTGVVRSVVPPFPTRIASLDSRGNPAPLTIPLKTTKKGAAAPFLGFSPEFGLCGDRLRLAKRATDASLIDRRGSRNTLRLFRMYLARKSVCARYVWLPLQKRRLFDFHTSNIQRARTERLAQRIVRLGNPIRRPPEGRSLRDAPSVNGIQKQNAFSGATAPFASPAPLFSPFFSGKTEKNGPAERR